MEGVCLNAAENTVIATRTRNVSAQFSILSTYFAQDNQNPLDSERKFDKLAEDVAGVFLNRIQVIDENFTIVSDTYQINKGKLCISPDVNRCFNGTNQAYTDKQHKCLVLTQSIKNSDGEVEYVMFATSSIADIYDAMDSIRLIVAAVVIILTIVLLTAAIFSAYKMVKPFRKIEDTIEHIGRGGTVEAINLKGSSEIITISNSFNTMMDRINQLEDSRQEFVSNVSHELKTPITSMKVLAESLVGQEGVPEELYQEFLGDIVGELDRENNIINDLLTLVKMDRTGLEMNFTQVNINELIEAQLKLIRPLAAQKNIELVFESFRPILAEIDETKFSMCISNLVVNAIKYNNNEGWVHVSLNADATYFYVKVQDNGFGIPEKSVEHIFDRFYRVDKARDRATGGTGLGLAITKSIVVAHNGDIKLHSEVDVGSTFIMQIPLTHIS
ncbi:MAG: cell wall metabolism sensor histidine kinase WalK [Lachnospiraceae bacterium]|nr:cell wall metabolism sensor histidine kinase WalK [Lachnospiraceae bacterium]